MLARYQPAWHGHSGKTYVKVVELKLLEGLVESSLDVLGLVVVVPQLGSDPDVLTLEAGDLGEGLLDTLGDLGLVLVDLGEIEVTVAGLEGLVDTDGDFAGGGLPGAVSQSARITRESVLLGVILSLYSWGRGRNEAERERESGVSRSAGGMDGGVILQTYGISAPVLSLALVPKDIFAEFG